MVAQDTTGRAAHPETADARRIRELYNLDAEQRMSHRQQSADASESFKNKVAEDSSNDDIVEFPTPGVRHCYKSVAHSPEPRPPSRAQTPPLF